MNLHCGSYFTSLAPQEVHGISYIYKLGSLMVNNYNVIYIAYLCSVFILNFFGQLKFIHIFNILQLIYD